MRTKKLKSKLRIERLEKWHTENLIKINILEEEINILKFNGKPFLEKLDLLLSSKKDKRKGALTEGSKRGNIKIQKSNIKPIKPPSAPAPPPKKIIIEGFKIKK